MLTMRSTPASAQVNLFIVTNYLSNGGKVFNLNFKGQQELERQPVEL